MEEYRVKEALIEYINNIIVQGESVKLDNKKNFIQRSSLAFQHKTR